MRPHVIQCLPLPLTQAAVIRGRRRRSLYRYRSGRKTDDEGFPALDELRPWKPSGRALPNNPQRAASPSLDQAGPIESASQKWVVRVGGVLIIELLNGQIEGE